MAFRLIVAALLLSVIGSIATAQDTYESNIGDKALLPPASKSAKHLLGSNKALISPKFIFISTIFKC